VDSSVYRRDKDGRIFGTDETKPQPAQQQKAQQINQPVNPVQESAVPRQVIAKSKPKLNLSQLTLPPVIKNIFSKKNKAPATPFTKATYYAKRIVIFYLVFFVLLGIKTSLSLQKIEASSTVAAEDTAGTNWLLVGSDSREGLTLEEQQELHTGQDEGAQRTDTIMLVHIGSNGTTLVSLPRDSYIYIPEHTDLDGNFQEQRRNKLNAAYSQGGAPLLVETVEFNTGLKIDHYMEIGFKGIRDLTDAVGGVDICVPQDYNDEKSNLNVKAGCQELDGVTALAYVRMRYADPKGDIGRIERQQQYLGAVIKKVSKVTTVLNPIAMWRVSSAGTDSVILGEGDSVRDVARLGLAMRSIASGNGNIATVPISDPAAETAAGSSVIWDKEAALEFFAQLAAN
jgi:LCP family protein required for cell wall assembly